MPVLLLTSGVLACSLSCLRQSALQLKTTHHWPVLLLQTNITSPSRSQLPSAQTEWRVQSEIKPRTSTRPTPSYHLGKSAIEHDEEILKEECRAYGLDTLEYIYLKQNIINL
ncbi:unnamed protein product [Meganyctiphanes norvegica]|uniref:Uncharacterized protein n=1 Tax=Meganyctiphanes norvegica TaxID=48144 RepID=A0AAV2RX90_MEGNR